MKKLFENWKKFLSEDLTEQAVIGADYEDTSDEPTVDAPAQQVSKLAAPYVKFGKQFLQSPVASLAPEAAKNMRDSMEYLSNSDDTEYENSDLEAELPSFIDRLLRAEAQYAAKHYAEGDAAAGENYMRIKEFLEGPTNEMLRGYNQPLIPSINLWVDDFDANEQYATGQSVSVKYYTGDAARNKVLSMGRYNTWESRGVPGILASI